MRLIDADEIKYREQLEWFGNGRYEPIQFVYESDIDIQPTVDAVPVIRCKDCAYYRPYSDGKYDCDNLLGMADAYEDGFCSRAERKEE